jgi:dolichyl-phosphate-mannose--protein O-mannosyl transferase
MVSVVPELIFALMYCRSEHPDLIEPFIWARFGFGILLFININTLQSKPNVYSLAGAISTKYVGLFIYLYVGLHTIGSLWSNLGDTAVFCSL